MKACRANTDPASTPRARCARPKSAPLAAATVSVQSPPPKCPAFCSPLVTTSTVAGSAATYEAVQWTEQALIAYTQWLATSGLLDTSHAP